MKVDTYILPTPRLFSPSTLTDAQSRNGLQGRFLALNQEDNSESCLKYCKEWVVESLPQGARGTKILKFIIIAHRY